ncbi:alpha/beta fold hydrolase [[Actinomadura] parvosata]|uniref:alpha/beta fold hydrolase n=1 Tax=[Actinomadura] parvosata TaxID=1955412 RepID=UPI00406C93CC
MAGWLRGSGLERPCLLGGSFGCQVAVDLAARHPGVAGALVLVAFGTSMRDRIEDELPHAGVPALVVRGGPDWMVFNAEQSHARAMACLDGADPFDEIRLMLFSHGVESVGPAGVGEWRRVPARARKVGVFTGVDTRPAPTRATSPR